MPLTNNLCEVLVPVGSGKLCRVSTSAVLPARFRGDKNGVLLPPNRTSGFLNRDAL